MAGYSGLLFTTNSPITLFILYYLYILSPNIPTVNGANILAVLPSVWQSHYLFGQSLLQQLVDQQNHSVTLISPYCKKQDDGIVREETATVSNIREIFVDQLLSNWEDMGLSFDIEFAHQQSTLERFTRLIYAGTANVDSLLTDANVRKLLRSSEKFDLIVIDLFLSDALLGLALYYNAPTIIISPNGANTWLNRMVGNPQSSALDPSNFLPYTERMSIWERCANTLMGLFEKLTYNFFHMISQQAVYLKHFQPLHQLANNTTVPLPHHRDLTQNLSLVLLNSHPVVQYPRAFLPNVLSIGGLHLQTEKQQLPNHLKSFIEGAEKGVVYVSFGADARTVDLAREKLDALLDVITYMEELRFLLKWEIDDYPKNLPQNLLTSPWFPQEAILEHTNVKVFISACGLMSVLESIKGQTPLLAIPIYPEQFVTAKRLEAHGLAQIVHFDSITYETLLNGIKELHDNTSYNKQLQIARDLLSTDYGTPIERTLHYIDLVLSTGGADFLKTHAHHLNFMRAKLFDVIAIIAFGLGGILAIPFLVICCILKRSYHSNQNATTTLSTTTTTNAAAAAAAAATISNATITGSSATIPRTRSKVSLPNNVNTIPLSKQEAGSSPRKITRQLSASVLWTTTSSCTQKLTGGTTLSTPSSPCSSQGTNFISNKVNAAVIGAGDNNTTNM